MFELLLYGFIAYVIYSAFNTKKGKRRKQRKGKSKRWYEPKARTMSQAEVRERVRKEKMKMEHTYHVRTIHLEKQRLLREGFNRAGVYIFANLNNGKKYVGQSVNILNRVETHIKGRGSSDMYEDLKRGHEFVVQMIKIEDTHYFDLNHMERDYIKKHNAYSRGYNKTRGNS